MADGPGRQEYGERSSIYEYVVGMGVGRDLFVCFKGGREVSGINPIPPYAWRICLYLQSSLVVTSPFYTMIVMLWVPRLKEKRGGPGNGIIGCSTPSPI